jgi:hypothetical protein
VLLARDGAGQEGRSEAALLTLPERSFTHPVAQALIALRKALSLDPNARAEARRELDRLAAEPEAFEHDTTTFLALRSARHRLTRDRRQESVTEAQEIMWETALALEEGRADRTARALAQAREQLREALDQAARNSRRGASRTPSSVRRPTAASRSCATPSAGTSRRWPSACSARMPRRCPSTRRTG